VQLVLDDQIGRIEFGAVKQGPSAKRGGAVKTDTLLEMVHMPEEGPAFAKPGSPANLSDGRN